MYNILKMSMRANDTISIIYIGILYVLMYTY